MWSVWLVFCDCGFHSACLLMDDDKRLAEASWWEGLNVGIQFSVDGWGCIPSLLFGLRPNYGTGNLLQENLCQHCCIYCPWPHGRLLSTHASARDSRTLTGKSDSISCGGQCSFLLGPGMDKVLFVPSKLPQSFGSSVIKSQPDSLVGKPIVGPRTFVTVQELLWYNFSPVCGLSAQCQHIWKPQQWPQDWKRSVFIPIPKKGNAFQSTAQMHSSHMLAK